MKPTIEKHAKKEIKLQYTECNDLTSLETYVLQILTNLHIPFLNVADIGNNILEIARRIDSKKKEESWKIERK